MRAVVIFLCILHAVFSLEPIRYDGFEVVRILPQSERELGILKTIKDEAKQLKFWKGPTAVQRPVDIMVSPERKEELKRFLQHNEMQLNTYIPDVQELIELGKLSGVKENSGFGWKAYYTFEEIIAWLDDLPNRYSQVNVINIGKTYEGRDLKVVHISYSANNSNNAIFLEANIHACEWIGSSTATYILNQLLTSTDEKIRWIAESYDWYILAVANPDGFSYAHETDRLWRKTRSPQGECVGTDPNRNWDNHWAEAGASTDPCSEEYAGPKPFSENCTKHISDFLAKIAHKLVGYIDFHSYSQLLLIPYGWTNEHLDNFDLVYNISLIGMETLSQRYGTQYQVGNIYSTIYPASGSSMDWLKADYKVPVVVCFELRDTGEYGFLLPPGQIIPTGEETLDGIIKIFEEYEEQK